MLPRKLVLALLVLCLTAAFAAACGAPKDPAERVDEIRSGYTAVLNSFIVEQTPLTGDSEDMTAGEGAGAMQEEAAEGSEGGEEMAPQAAAPLRQDAVLDILMSRKSRESLPGITVDVEQVGPEPERPVKRTYRVYLDTSEVGQGGGTQISHRLEGVDYAQGDGFHVEVRYPIPPGERGEYREFQEFAEGRQ